MQYHYVDTPVGRILAVANNHLITGLYWEVFTRRPAIGVDWIESNEPFQVIKQQLDEYFAGARTAFDVPTATTGTAFQKAVWEQIAQIPHGASISYADIARSIGRPKAVRAVGTAVGSNPISIVIPCHRVLTSTGHIGGYAGGLDAKRQLLALERISLKT